MGYSPVSIGAGRTSVLTRYAETSTKLSKCLVTIPKLTLVGIMIHGDMNFILTPLLMLGCVVSASAGFKLPSHVYRADQLEEAAEKAKGGDKALAFVYTDETST